MKLKLLKAFQRAFSVSRTGSDDSLQKLHGATKRRKTIEDADEIPYQLIGLPDGFSLMDLNEDQHRLLKERALHHLQPVLKKALNMKKKELAKTISALKHLEPANVAPTDKFSIFGTPLSQIPAELINSDSQLPHVIVQLMYAFVFGGGFEQEGPFRIEGDKQLLNQLVNGISQGVESDEKISSYPLPVIGAAIKRYLRQIPGSLIPEVVSSLLHRLSRIQDSELKTFATQLLLLTLPFRHAKAFSTVLLLLKACSTRESTHKMSASALSVCFGPTLFNTGTDLQLLSAINAQLSDLITDFCKYTSIPSSILK